MTILEFRVPAMSCGHCARTIRSEVGAIAGVRAVEADAPAKLVRVQFEAPATREQIEARLTEINYAPAPVESDARGTGV